MISPCKRVKLDSYLHNYKKKPSKWIRDLNVRAKVTKLLEENIGLNLHDLGLSNGFLNMIPKTQQQALTDRCDAVGWASSCKVKGHWFKSQSGHMPGLWVRALVRACTRGN